MNSLQMWEAHIRGKRHLIVSISYSTFIKLLSLIWCILEKLEMFYLYFECNYLLLGSEKY